MKDVNTFMSRWNTICSIAMVVMFAMVGCRGEDRPTPPKPEPIPKEEKGEEEESRENNIVRVFTEVYLKEGTNLTKLAPISNDSTTYPQGVVIGAGEYQKGNIATLKVSTSDFLKYTLVSVHEKEGKQGFTKEKGLINENTEVKESVLSTWQKENAVSAETRFYVTDSMTFIVVFEEYHPQPISYRKIDSHDYWVRKNQDAMDYIKPRIVKLDTFEEVKKYTWFGGLKTELSETIVKRDIFRYSRVRFDFWLDALYADDPSLGIDYKPKGDYNRAIRYAYALTNMAGDIVEIYPPTYSATNDSHTALNYITVPEGTYKVVILVNMPNDREVWYQLPRITTFSKPDAYYGENHGWVYGMPLPEGQDWFKDSEIIHVKERNHLENITPIWDEVELRSLNNEIGTWLDVDIVVKVTNPSNQRIEGTVTVTDEYSKWFHEEGRALMDIRMAEVKKRGQDPGAIHMYEYRSIDRGQINITLLPYESKEITFRVLDRSYYSAYASSPWPYDDKDEWSLLERGFHTNFYWNDKGSEERRFMQSGGEEDMHKMMELNWGDLNAKYVFFFADARVHDFKKEDCAMTVLWNVEEWEENVAGRNCIVF